MASTYTDRLGLEKQTDGENPNSWGAILNTNVIDLIDDAIAGYEIVSVSSTGITLTDNQGSTDQSRNAALEFAGTLTANVTITVPAEEKTYFVRENTTGSFAVQMKTVGGTALTLSQGVNTFVACNGTSIYRIDTPTSVASFTANTLTATTLTATSISTSVLSSSIITVNTSATFQQVSVEGALTVVGATALNSTVSLGAAAIGILVSSNATGDTTLNLQNGNFFKLTLTGNTSVTTPTNIAPGQSGIIYLIQDGTGGRSVSFSDVWNFSSGVTVTPTSVADSVDLISYFVRGVSAIDVASALDFK
jgi:hypothetical protein|tara:strand:+ start:286 stop:1203 length:918 start_codon:yes stop_codon:yes gene_type:complete